MNPLRSEYARLFELLANLAEHRLSGADALELREMLLTDPQARDIYRRYQVIVAGLSWECADPSVHAGLQIPVADTLGSATTPPSDEAAQTAAFGGITRPIVRPVVGLYRGTAAALRRPVFWSICAVGAMFCLYAGVLLWNLRGGKLPIETDGEEIMVATIRETSNVEWSEAADREQGTGDRNPKSEVTAGESLSIEAGLVELRLKRGVTLIVEGPAEWTIDGNNNATLKRGKLVATVPQQAIGFTLETPTAKIVDLGTEFGVEVSESGAADVHVLKGQVDVQRAKGSTKQGPGILVAGQSVRITNQGVATIQTSSTVPKEFKRLVDAGNTQVPEPPAGPASGLVAYYPFDDDTRDHAAEYAANSGKTADDLKIIGPSEYLVGQVGRALRLTGGYGTAPISSDLQLPPIFTIEAWIVREQLTDGWQRLVLNWGDVGQRAYHLALVNNQVSLYIQQADGHEVHVDGGQVRMERWEHIAAVANGKQLRVFINGLEIARQPYDGTLFVNLQESLGVGDSASHAVPNVRFRGAMDELAIWKIALTNEQIAEHVRRAHRGIGLISADRKEVNARQPPP